MINRFGGDFAKVRKVTSEQNWKQPLKWDRQAYVLQCQYQTERTIDTPRPRVFCASLADVFEDWQGPMHNHKGQELYRAWHHAQPDWVASDFPAEGEPLTMHDVRYRLFELIDSTMNLDWLVLTKRPENIRKMWRGWQGDLLDWRSEANPKYRDNVWLGTTVENQEYADKRIPELLKCHKLAPVLFLSVEPMLGPIGLTQVSAPGGWMVDAVNGYWTTEIQSGPDTFELGQCEKGPAISWCIVGCESGPHRRKTELDWVRSLRDQCHAAGIPFFCKQLEVDGKVTDNIEDFPEDLRIQEFPSATQSTASKQTSPRST